MCVRDSWKLATIVCLLVLAQRLPPTSTFGRSSVQGFAFLGAAWTCLSRCLYGPPTKNVQNRTCLLPKHVLQSF